MRSLSLFLTLFILFSLSFISPNLNSQHPNNITIRSDRVFELNGQPFFPIMLSNELGPVNTNCQLVKNQLTGELWGFNVINLQIQLRWYYNCFGLGFSYCDPGYKVRNIISGDINTSQQYYNLLHGNEWNITWDVNANRIFDYCSMPGSSEANKIYLFSDAFAFFPSTVSHFVQNPGLGDCEDFVVMQPPMNQTVRHQAIERLNQLAQQPNIKLIGFYSMDDANMMGTLPHTAQYYYDNIDLQIAELQESYNYAKSLYPNSA